MNQNFIDMIKACETGDIDTVRRLLPHTDVKYFQSQALRAAVHFNHTDIALLLLPLSDPSVKRYSVLFASSYNKNKLLFDALSENIDIFNDSLFANENLFSYTCSYGWLEKIKEMEDAVSISQENYDNAYKLMTESDNVYADVLNYILPKTSFEGRAAVIPKMIKNKETKMLEILSHHHEFSHDLFNYFCGINRYSDCVDDMIKKYNAEKHGPLNKSSLAAVFCLAAGDLDWVSINLLLPFIDIDYMKKQEYIMTYMALHADIDVYNYFLSLGFDPTPGSLVEACHYNKQLVQVQMSEKTVSATALHWLAANGWNDLLKDALNTIPSSKLSNAFSVFKPFTEDEDSIFLVPCVENKNYEGLEMIFEKLASAQHNLEWLPNLCLNCFHDKTFLSMAEKYVSGKGWDKTIVAFIETDDFSPMEIKTFIRRVLKNHPGGSDVLSECFDDLMDDIVLKDNPSIQEVKLLHMIAPYVDWSDIDGFNKEKYDEIKSKQDNKILSRNMKYTKGTPTLKKERKI